MFTRPPFEAVGPLVRVCLFWAGVVLVVRGALLIDGLHQADPAACRERGDCVRISQVDLQFAWTEPAFRAATNWTDATRRRATEALRADSWILVPGYVLVLAILCGAAARRSEYRGYSVPGVLIAWSVFVAGAADLAENTLISMALESPATATLQALAVATCTKWALAGIAAVHATVVPLTRWVRQRG
jgi:hypothetical protein